VKKILSIFLIATAFAGVAQAQETNYVDVSGGNHAPLYDCSIYSFPEDRRDCSRVKQELFQSNWEAQGYAINCYDARVGRRTREKCLDLADRVLSNSHTIDCGQLYRDRYAQRQCQVTKRGYENGMFNSRYIAPAPLTPVIPRHVPSDVFIVDEQYRSLCGPEAYDANYQRWVSEKRRLEDRGRARAIGGAAATIFGTILRGSDDSGTRAVGSLLTIGGVVVMVAGAVDLQEARMSLPHVNAACRNYYVPEVRMVTYEREVCRTTQWTERGWGYSRSYYEVQCSSRTYVTYERNFSPWHSGRPYRAY
jgi:hypothetical protein